jgi:hypothetical protein
MESPHRPEVGDDSAIAASIMVGDDDKPQENITQTSDFRVTHLR